MTCYHPVPGLYNKDKGQILFGCILDTPFDRKYAMNACLCKYGTYDLTGFENCSFPCGKCVGCLLNYSHSWIGRLMAHLFTNKMYCGNLFASFITLTYDDEHLPLTEDGLPTLRFSDFQLFMKRLRKHMREYYGVTDISYYVVGEYGSQKERPHYHAILFGVDFNEYFRLCQFGSKYKFDVNRIQKNCPADTVLPFFRMDMMRQHGTLAKESRMLESLWKQGICVVGDVNEHTIGYCSRYAGKMKMIVFRDKQQKEEYFKGRVPYFSHCSKGLGEEFFNLYHDSIFAHGRLQIPGCKFEYSIPRYYEKKLKTLDPEKFDAYKAKKCEYFASPEFFKENTPDRLKVREICQKIRFKKLVRFLDASEDTSSAVSQSGGSSGDHVLS